jgi:hypothetical protein
VRLLFVDGGAYHQETVAVPKHVLRGYDRLIDCLREDPVVLKEIYVDVGRLAAAWLVADEGGAGQPRADVRPS